MIKTLALVAAAGFLALAAPSAPASAQGISVHVGGGGYHGGHRGWHRDHGWRRSRAFYGHRHGGWHHGRRW